MRAPPRGFLWIVLLVVPVLAWNHVESGPASLTNYGIMVTNSFTAHFITNRNHIDWIGKVVAADDKDKFTPKGVCWLPDYELGLRDDGVVVWRKATK